MKKSERWWNHKLDDQIGSIQHESPIFSKVIFWKEVNSPIPPNTIYFSIHAVYFLLAYWNKSEFESAGATNSSNIRHRQGAKGMTRTQTIFCCKEAINDSIYQTSSDINIMPAAIRKHSWNWMNRFLVNEDNWINDMTGEEIPSWGRGIISKQLK